MKSIVIKNQGGLEVMRLEEVPLLVCQANQVIVKVKAIGVSRCDMLQRQARTKPPKVIQKL